MAKLAINGGKPCVTKRGRVQWPVTTETDAKHVAEVVRHPKGNWCRLSPGDDEVTNFEKEWAAFQDAKYALLINNGTVAIECGLQALGIKPGDEVIVPAITFIASASGVLMARGLPVFADVDPKTCQIDAKDIEQKITKRTTGIVVVHYGGYPANMTAIKKVAKKHGLFVFEDCAHAHGTQWKGRRVGAIGDCGSFSFQGSKSLTAGEGGAIVTNRRDVLDACWAYHTIGRSLGSEKYEHEIVGPNLRVSEIQAAVLRTQLKKLPGQNKKRNENAAILRAGLKEVPGVVPLKEDKRVTDRGYYYFVMLMDEATWGVKKATLLQAFNAEGLRIGSGYSRPVYRTKVFANNQFDATGWPTAGRDAYGPTMSYDKVCCPVAEDIAFHRQLTLGTHDLLSKQRVNGVLRIFKKLWKNRAELQEFEKKQAASA